MNCINADCNGKCVKNGHIRGAQRYQCKKCKRTFAESVIEKAKQAELKRLVLHLTISGCKFAEIAKELKIFQRTVKRWQGRYLKMEYEKIVISPKWTTKELIIDFRQTEKVKPKMMKRLKKRRFLK